ncbi:hypothetical protein QTJ16_006693 [Diplocarpon rosae]|uniref:Major facilitator superfamily (MFS) profile domain-containing protein n=1 Tax=Diplocarpon rosae TaxID=946125 RepID=A0AAD9SVU5_9HELO|nr:hypothetical protein QTJ16_006693 [Diplocarpon rosae]
MILKRWRASMWFPLMMVAWGVTMTLTGLVTNFRGLVIARVFLGATESGLFPGVNYYITLWYPRRECAFRAAVFFSAATVAGAFGGLLARAINEMSGVGGKPGWAWIFILEGILTVLVSIVAFFVMADNPETATFLTPEETKEVHLRLKQDNDSLAHHFETRFMIDALTDWKIWMQSVYRNQDKPRYSLGHGICLGFLGISLAIVALQMFILTYINKLRDGEHPSPREYTSEMKKAEMDKGDRASFFRYTV